MTAAQLDSAPLIVIASRSRPPAPARREHRDGQPDGLVGTMPSVVAGDTPNDRQPEPALLRCRRGVAATIGPAAMMVPSPDSFALPGSAAAKGAAVPSLAPQNPAPALAARGDRCADDDARRRERDAHLAALLARAAAGSASAFEAFYDATVAYAQALGRRMLPPAELEDVLADAYFQAWRELPRFDPARGSPVSWLLTIVRSRALDLLRHRRSSPIDELGDDAPDGVCDLPGPQALLEGAQQGGRLHQALAELSANERWVLGLAYYRELPHARIAECTGLPLGTVKSLILRAQHKLRERLA